MNKWVKILFLFVLIGTLRSAHAQDDIGVVAKLSPSSGCQLGSALNVTVQVFNFGPTNVTSSFDVSYTVNGSPPTTETVSLGTFNAFSSYTHTFASTVNLSTPGSYSLVVYTTLGTDGNTSNDALSFTVVNDASSVGGSLPVDFAVCQTSNSGTLNLTGYTGSVTDWEFSTNGGGTWTGIGNTNDSQSYSNLSQSTSYRAIVKNGSCPQVFSSEVLISVDPASVGGTTSGPTTVCSGPNSANISLSGEQGVIQDWEISVDGGSTWTSLSDNSNPLVQSNLTQTSLYRAIVQSGTCSSDISSTLEITVISNIDGGDLSPALDSACISGNSGSITLSNQIGTIDHWEFSEDLVSWNSISNTSTTQSYNNLTNTTYYRVILTGCSTDTSTLAQINVNPLSVAGTIPTTQDICSGDDILNLSASGSLGNISAWESSTDGGSTWNLIGSNSSLDFTNVTVSQQIRYTAQSGSCPLDISNSMSINVSQSPAFASIIEPGNICVLNNSDSVVYSGVIGTINDWIASTDNGVSWNSLGDTDTMIYISPIVSSTYGMIVQSAGCPIDTFFNDVVVSPESIGLTLPNDTSFCAGNNSLTFTPAGGQGIHSWYTADVKAGPYVLSNTGNTFTTNDPFPSYVYVETTSGVCPTVYSDTMSITVLSSIVGIVGDTVVGQFEEASFTAFGGDTYLWNNDPSILDPTSATQTVSITDSITYTVLITDANGCVYTSSIHISVISEDVTIATLITPNSDGFNDIWLIKAPADMGVFQVTISNPFGQIVYQNDDYQNDWDGSYKGKKLPNGAYFFQITNETLGTVTGALNILAND